MVGVKFRAWDGEKMVCPIAVDEDGKAYTSWGKTKDWPLMQSTGLRSKFGREIFEGDILELDDGEGWVVDTVPVVFVNGAFMTKETNCCDLIQPELSVVIGNIYENPNLLTTKEAL